MGEHLLIDGYNILHAWPAMRSLLRARRDAAAARLLEVVRVVHDFEGWALTLVFDGQGDALTIEHPDDGNTALTVVYAPRGVTADGIIERLLARTPQAEDWVVATGDHAIAQTALANGARAIGPAELQTWIEAVEARQTRWLQRRSNEVDESWRSV